MADYIINSANLRGIENGLQNINHNINTLNSNIGIIERRVNNVDDNVRSVDNNVRIVYDEIGALARDFHDFVQMQVQANALSKAQQRIIQIHQELEKKFGHYDVVRKTATGILQANDVGIVRKESISSATEELMITAPGYWLAPCLVALAAWISDQPELAERALKEAIKRNDEKTSLFFALICRRADRKSAALKWTQRYLANQYEEKLNRETIIILDAYAGGLLGADSEGIISKQMEEWLEHLENKPGFVEQQTKQWSDAINLKRKPFLSNNYTYLSKYSKSWGKLKLVMEGAMLHAEILEYFTNIFNQESSTESLKAQLDGILDNLVTEFDEEELPLRKEEKFNQFIIDFEGDEDRARRNMALEESAFDVNKDFTQLLTDAAMKPESSNSSVSTQKFAIALSKEWISNAYNDITAQNRALNPVEIEINVDTFNGKTKDGRNETEVINSFNRLVDSEKAKALAGVVVSGFEKFCLYGGAIIMILGLFLVLTDNIIFGLIAGIAGIGMMINYFSKNSNIKKARKKIEAQFEEKRENGSKIIRATLAEIVDFRADFARLDSESEKVIDFLEQITPNQYVRKLADSNRRIKV